MPESIQSTIFISASIVGVIILLLLGITSMWRKVSQDKALVVTGLRKRVISGGGGLVVPLLEKTDRISLENMTIEMQTNGALTAMGVPITVNGFAVIKIKSDKESILAAVEQFNTGAEVRTVENIKKTAKNVLEGKLREIISEMTVEGIYQDRKEFGSRVQEIAATDLATMGLEIKAFTITDIDDINGYLEALGKKQIAEVKKNAEIAEAEAHKEAKIRTAEANRQGEEARLIAEAQIAQSVKDRELKIQAFRKEQESSRAVADLAYSIEENKVKREVTETQMQVEILKKEKEIQLAQQEALRREQELEATIVKEADAEKYRQAKQAEAGRYSEIQEAEAQAQSIRLRGQASADARRLEGMAEVEIIREKGKAEAEAMLAKAEAYRLYNEAAMTQMMVEKLPEIARAISEPLSRTEKIVIVDGGGGKGASKVTEYVTDIMAKLPETVGALTGVDLMQLLTKGAAKGAQATGQPASSVTIPVTAAPEQKSSTQPTA